MKRSFLLLPLVLGCSDTTGPDRDRFLGTWDMIVSYSGNSVPDTTWQTPDYAIVLVSATLEISSQGVFRARDTHVYQEIVPSEGSREPFTAVSEFIPEIHGDTLYLYPSNAAETGAQPDKLVMLANGMMNTVCRGIYHSDCQPEPILWQRR